MNILAVEELWWDRKQLVKHLKKAMSGAKIIAFDNTADALAFAKKNAVDVAFIDFGKSYQTPGYFLAKKILEIQKTNIVITNAEWTHLQDVFALRVSGYIRKPLQYEDILREFDNLRYPLMDEDPAGTTTSNERLMLTLNRLRGRHKRLLSNIIRFFH